MNNVLLALWLFLPAGIANAAPVISGKIPWLKRWRTPMDFGKTYRGKRILGDNKTWRGFAFGVFCALVTIKIQQLIWEDNFTMWGMSEFWFSVGRLANYYSDVYLWGALLGIGALLGDAAESFLKRQRGIPAGQSWFPLDQIDYVIGGLLLSSPVVFYSGGGYLIILSVWFCVHVITVFVFYHLGIRDKPI